MPYIKQDRRDKFLPAAQQIGRDAEVAGDLNYAITEMLHEYIRKTGIKYDVFNSCIGLLECAKLELYRRQIGLYEDSCITRNGDTSSLTPIEEEKVPANVVSQR